MNKYYVLRCDRANGSINHVLVSEGEFEGDVSDWFVRPNEGDKFENLGTVEIVDNANILPGGTWTED